MKATRNLATTSDMVFEKSIQGSNPLYETARGKLQTKRSKLNDQINKEVRIRNGAENLFRASTSKKTKETVALELSFVNSNLQLLKEELAEMNSSVEIYQNSSSSSTVPMIPLGLKETKEIDFSQTFKDYIEEHYSEDSRNYEDVIAEFCDLRQAVRTPVRSDDGVKLLFEYYNQLYFIERRFFPLHRSLQLYFHWFDSLTGVPTMQRSLAFEKGSILFNIAALYTQLAARQDRTKMEGLDAAISYFQRAIGVLKFIRDRFSQPPSMDLQPDSITMLCQLFFAQCQECVYEKCTLDGVDEGVENYVRVAQEAAMVAQLYSETHKLMTRDHVKDYVPFSWISMMLVKSEHFKASSHYYLAIGLTEHEVLKQEEIDSLFEDLHTEGLDSERLNQYPKDVELRNKIAKSHLQEALVLHEDALRDHSLCRRLRKIDAFLKVLKPAHERSLKKLATLEDEDDFSEVMHVSDIIPKTYFHVTSKAPDFSEFKVEDLFVKLGPLSVFSARHEWSSPRIAILNKSKDGYGFSVRGESPVIVADVEAGSVAESVGVKVGDFIISIEGTDTKWAKHEQVVELVKGSGDSLTITVVTPINKNFLQPENKDATVKSSISVPGTPIMRQLATPSGTMRSTKSSASTKSRLSGLFTFKRGAKKHDTISPLNEDITYR